MSANGDHTDAVAAPPPAADRGRSPPRRLTVLHVDTQRGWRGGQRQTFWLARGLARAGHRSLVAARPGDALAVRAAAEGLPVFPCAPFAEVDLWSAFNLRRVLVREHVQIVHAHAGHAVSIAALASLGTGARLVLTRRVDLPLRRNPGSRWKYGRADAVIAISEAVARVLRASGVDESRMRIVPSGVDLTRDIRPASRETLDALGVPDGVPLVVMVAALVDPKDPVTFVHAIAEARRAVPDLHALVVGDGPLRPSVEAAVTACFLGGVLHLAGHRDDADSLLAAADVAVQSSKDEGLGTALVDALALGLPIAATRAGGIPEVVEDGASGLLVPVGDASGLGRAIARLLSDRALAERMAEQARRRSALFSIERTVEGTLRVYEEVLRGTLVRDRALAPARARP